MTQIPLPVTRAEIEEILLFYSSGKLRSFSLMGNGYANSNILIRTRHGKLVLRLYHHHPLENILLEVKLLSHLARYNFPTPVPLADSEGHMIWHTSQFPAVLFSFLKGHHPRNPERYIRQVAFTLAALHNVNDWEPFARKASVTPGKCRKLSEEMKKWDNMDKKTYTLFKKNFGRLEKYLEEPLPRGLVHGDLFPDNMLVRKGKISAILDFEDYFTGPLIYDIAMAVNGFCLKNGFYHRRMINRFITAYEYVRKLSEEERRLLPVYIGWTAVAMAAWHLLHPRKELQQSQKKRIRELLSRAKRWMDLPENGF